MASDTEAVVEALEELAADDESPTAAAAADDGDEEDNPLMARAQVLMDKIIASRVNPNPRHLHALASMLEAQESRYVQESGTSSSNNGRASHSIGKLGNLVRENDDFFEFISSNFLSESRYSISVQAAAARLLLSCSATWMYPHVFEDAVLENIKKWVMEDIANNHGDEYNWKANLDGNNPTDGEMLKTYGTGLLAVSLDGGAQVVEDILTSGLSAKLMRFLRMRVLGDMQNIQDTDSTHEAKHDFGVSHSKGKEESRGRLRQVMDITHFDASRTGNEKSVDDGMNSLDSQEFNDASTQVIGTYEIEEDDSELLGGDRQHNRHFFDGKLRHSDRHGTSRSSRDDDEEENARDDSSRRRTNKALSRTRGKGRMDEGLTEYEREPVRVGVPGRGNKDQNYGKNAESKRSLDTRKFLSTIDADVDEDNDDRFKDCIVGTKDISDLVKKATRAAEAEARAANGSPEAIRAAGDDAAELVKSAALEAFKSTNDEEAAVLAASKAACTVVDAAMATDISCKVNSDTVSSKAVEPETEDLEEFSILDTESLGHLREKYCIQCLEILGEYVEVLGLVLHEKGVDVCLALLQRSIKTKEKSEDPVLLPEILKLICALAAHRKFAAVFVDRGGMQKLLSVQRDSQTFFGLSSCLFTIGSLQGIMERVCALPPAIVHQVVELALQLLECPQDHARKNAAIFFTSAFVFRAILDAFDAQDGLQKMLNLLRGAASVRSGGNSGALGLGNVGPMRNDQAPVEVLTASEKQIAYHTCFALRQLFRAHLLLLVDSLRPNKSHRSVARSNPSARAAYRPLDISNEPMEAVFLQMQRDRKLGPAFVRARWPVVDKFLASNGHTIMLELCQAPPGDRYLHDLAQYALGVLHIVTFVPYSRKLIINATLSNHRVGLAVILDAANLGYLEIEVIQSALNVLVNLVCPPPSISNKPFLTAQGLQSVSTQTLNVHALENKERNSERNVSDRTAPLSIQCEFKERSGEPNTTERTVTASHGLPSLFSSSQTAVPNVVSGAVGDRRISLGPGAGCAGLAAQLEQGYHQARDVVRANNGIKVLLHLLQPRVLSPPGAIDCIRVLACRVLLGLARDSTIAHILTKLQVGKKLSELIRDSGNQAPGTEQGRWQTELVQVAIELIGIVTNSGRASTLAATDAAAPTLRRIERATIAAATPITYPSRELLLLIHEHLQASGLTTTADSLLKEAHLTPLSSAGAPLLHQTPIQENLTIQLHWPSRRSSNVFLADVAKLSRDDDAGQKPDSVLPSSKKKSLAFSSSFGSQGKTHVSLHSSSFNKASSDLKSVTESVFLPETSLPVPTATSDTESLLKTPILMPMKRKFTDSKDSNISLPAKRLASYENALFHSPMYQTPNISCKPGLITDIDNPDDILCHTTPVGLSTPSTLQPGLLSDLQPGNTERVTLDSLVVQYLKHQHRQCPAPITTLPPLSLLHPHVCPEPRQSLDAPVNVTARLSTRECQRQYGGILAHRRDRQFVYSRFRPWRTCRDDAALLTCITFLGDASRIATGSHSGELKIFDSNNNTIVESHSCHQSPIMLVQSAFSGDTQLILSSGSFDVRLWDAFSISGGPLHSFEGCKAARFSHSGSTFAALSTDASHREVLLYDVQSSNLEVKFSDTNSVISGRVLHPLIHFNPSDSILLWNGVLWDRRCSGSVHRFDQFTDYGGGGFHPAGNEVIINSEVWDLRKFRLLRSVPSLDQTVISFNAAGDVIYAILRRNLEDVTSAVNTRRARHPLFPAFRTVDAVTYRDIATIPVVRCVLDFATEPTDSFVGVVALDDYDEMFSSAQFIDRMDFGGRGGILEIMTDGEDNDSEVDSFSSDDEGGFGPGGYAY
ncbi:hypothetical protein QJS04_geneDACA011484 [Acorus gramineus]|uniref:LisH domain-containing protein n=1 Tax=Acorus gramineus TaxID=55184 RepID=A0AAV9A2X1_ACOGR|nr:hypothetical protein QJS04_geneDACA011484 [Acorus gramineus]